MKKLSLLFIIISHSCWGMWVTSTIKHAGDMMREKTETQDPAVLQQQVADHVRMAQSTHQTILSNPVSHRSGSFTPWQVTNGIGMNHPEMVSYVTLQKEGSLGQLIKMQEELESVCKNKWFMPLKKEKALLISLKDIMDKPITTKLAACAHGTYEHALVTLQELVEDNRLCGGNLKEEVEQACMLASQNKNFNPHTCSLILTSPSSHVKNWGYLTKRAREEAAKLDMNSMTPDEYIKALTDIAEMHAQDLTPRQRYALLIDIMITAVDRAATNLRVKDMIEAFQMIAQDAFGKIYLPEERHMIWMQRIYDGLTTCYHALANDDRVAIRKAVRAAVDYVTITGKGSVIKNSKKYGSLIKSINEIIK